MLYLALENVIHFGCKPFKPTPKITKMGALYFKSAGSFSGEVVYKKTRSYNSLPMSKTVFVFYNAQLTP